ncbi:MAG: trypsin-like peptidase domain-containing protein [Candidatus Nanohaloarchaea archaeon]|nr:trypsin-like peptidase domain-containing protein [Candidatus Nanohaloarchaea archaeon]
MKESKLVAGMLLAILLSGVIGGYTAVKLYNQRSKTTTGRKPAIERSVDVNASAYQHAYQEVMDSVVSIKVVSHRGGSRGSGFVYSSKGHIVTNHHVVRGAERVEVKFRSGEWRTADIVGTDIYTDLAVLKVEDIPKYAKPLPVAESDPQPGSVVMALGNPFGLQETITQGIVSGVNRTMDTAGGFSIPDTVQTDAPINPGNSGGPLINTAGQVVGVNRAKQGDNIGFAISPSIITRVVPALIEKGSYKHAYLGVRMADVSPIVAEANNLKKPRGVIVSSVVEEGPADGKLEGSRMRAYTQTGTVPIGGDIVLSIEGRNVSAPRDISSFLATDASPGDRVSMTILRDGEEKQVELVLGERPAPIRYR